HLWSERVQGRRVPALVWCALRQIPLPASRRELAPGGTPMRVRCSTHSHEVVLCDDGSLDTVIEVDGHRVRYSAEYAAPARSRTGEMTARGLRQLAIDACEHGALEDETVKTAQAVREFFEEGGTCGG